MAFAINIMLDRAYALSLFSQNFWGLTWTGTKIPENVGATKIVQEAENMRLGKISVHIAVVQTLDT